MQILISRSVEGYDWRGRIRVVSQPRQAARCRHLGTSRQLPAVSPDVAWNVTRHLQLHHQLPEVTLPGEFTQARCRRQICRGMQ